MHETALINAQRFKNKYLKLTADTTVVDIGSYDVNGTLKPLFAGSKYIGLDQSAGPNVDVVAQATNTPFADSSVDVIVSTSCFEHDECFWETFLEMCRILKPGGIIYVNAPSAGPYHGFPGDCWRFYKDSWKALCTYANRKSYSMTLLESYIDESGGWKDSIGIFKKN